MIERRFIADLLNIVSYTKIEINFELITDHCAKSD